MKTRRPEIETAFQPLTSVEANLVEQALDPFEGIGALPPGKVKSIIKTLTNTAKPAESTPALGKLLKKSEVADFLGVTTRSVDNYLRSGVLKGTRLPRPSTQVRFTVSAVNEFLNTSNII